MNVDADKVHPGKMSVVTGCEAAVLAEALGAEVCAVGNAHDPHPGETAWSQAATRGRVNAEGRPLHRIETGKASAVVSTLNGAVLTGLRGVGFLSGEAAAASVEDIGWAAQRHLPWVLHVTLGGGGGGGGGERFPTRALQVLSGSGAVVFVAQDAQEACDLALIARRTAESALLPVVVVQEGFTAFDLWDQVLVPNSEWVRSYLGSSKDSIDSPTPGQRMVFGPTRPRIPVRWNVDQPAGTGVVRDAVSGALSRAGQGAFFQAPVEKAIGDAEKAFAEGTGRMYGPLGEHNLKKAKVVWVGQGSVMPTLMEWADRLGEESKARIGVVNLRRMRPFPGAELVEALRGRDRVGVLERADSGMAGDAPLLGEVRGSIHKALENAHQPRGGAPGRPHPDYPVYERGDSPPPLLSVAYGLGGSEPDASDLAGMMDHLLSGSPQPVFGFAMAGLAPLSGTSPQREILQHQIHDAFPVLASQSLRSGQSRTTLPPTPSQTLSLRMFGVHPSLGGVNTSALTDGHLEGLLAELGECRVKGWNSKPQNPLERPWMRQLLASKQARQGHGLPDRVDVLVMTDLRVLGMAEGVADSERDILSGLREGGDLLLVADSSADGEDLPLSVVRWLNGLQDRKIHVYLLHSRGPEDRTVTGLDGEEGGRDWFLAGALLALPALKGGLGVNDQEMGRAMKRWALLYDEGLEDAERRASGATLQSWMEAGVEAIQPWNPGDLAEEESGAAFEFPLGEDMPERLKDLPIHEIPAHDLHRFWVQTGSVMTHRREDTLTVDPVLTHGTLPPGSGSLRDVSSTRTHFPDWLPGPCSGCGDCWMVCPDGALSPQVNPIGDLLQAAVDAVEQKGEISSNLSRALRALEGGLKNELGALSAEAISTPAPLAPVMDKAIEKTLSALPGSDEEKEALRADLKGIWKMLEGFPLARTEPFYDLVEANRKGAGGWLSIVLDPARCKACGLCLRVCEEEALVWKKQTPETQILLHRQRTLQDRLPSTAAGFLANLGDGEKGAPTLPGLLLDRKIRSEMDGGGSGRPGDGERTVLRLFAAVARSEMQPRVEVFLGSVGNAIERLETHIRLNLAVDVTDPAALRQAMESLARPEFTLGELSERMDTDRDPVDTAWLTRVTGILAGLKALTTRFQDENGGREGGRTALGMVDGASKGSGSALEMRWPNNPFSFPWSGTPTSRGAAMSLGVFEGHMAYLAADFSLMRQAELELDGAYHETVHGPFFARFGWRDFNEEEWALCPPVVLAGDEGSLTDEGAGVLAGLWRSGAPIRVLNLVRCSPGAAGRSDSRPMGFGGGKGVLSSARESYAMPADPVFQAMATGRVFVAKGSLSDPEALAAGWRRGLASRCPALFSVYGGRPVSDASHNGSQETDGALAQARLAVQSRALPLLCYDPAAGTRPHECLELDGNIDPDNPWASQTLHYLDEEGSPSEKTTPLTFADFAVRHPAWQDHFSPIPPDAAEEGWVSLVDYLDLDADEQEDANPFIEVVGDQGTLVRVGMSPVVLAATGEALARWRLLRTLARHDVVPVDEEAIAREAGAAVTDTVWKNLMELARSEEGLTSERLTGLVEGTESAVLEGKEGGHA